MSTRPNAHSVLRKALFPITAFLLSFPIWLAASPATAATLHYWQFEPSPGFMADSVGSLSLATAQGTPLQVALPGAGRGSTFDDAVATTANAFETTGDDVLSAAAFPLNDFTVEAISHPDAVSAAFGHTLAGLANSSAGTLIGFVLQFRSSELALVLCNGGTCNVLSSGLAVAAGNDYYAAASVDLDGLSTTFYLQDLTAGGSLQSAVVAHTLVSMNSPTFFAIGGAADSSIAFDGLIDEVRISDHARSESELLINEIPTPVVPSLGLFGLGAMVVALLGVGARSGQRSTS